jgi:dTDP-4-amino-4,6-dideoxygalactose transaminase
MSEKSGPWRALRRFFLRRSVVKIGVPFHLHDIGEREVRAVSRVLRSPWINTGPETRAFEADLKALVYSETPGEHAVVCMSSATAGLFLALKAAGIGPGDEVIVPVYTYSASAAAVIHAGATPIPADVDALGLLGPAELAPRLSPRTRAVIAVDVGGLPCDAVALTACLESHRDLFKLGDGGGLCARLGRPLLIVDAAHSIGARMGQPSRAAASFPDIAVFSFHAVKNVSTGDGGAVCVKLPSGETPDFERSLRLWSLHGQNRTALEKMAPGAWKYDITVPGYKFNMTDIEAALGRVQLARLPETEQKKQRIADIYDKALGSSHRLQIRPRALAAIPSGECAGPRTASHHLYMIHADGWTPADRDRAISLAAESGVALNVHYQTLPMLSAWKQLGWRSEDFPVAKRLSESEISLPLFSRMRGGQVDRVIEVVSVLIR